MNIKKWINNNLKWFVLFFACLSITTGSLVAYENITESEDDIGFYDDCFKCDLILEQRVASRIGCNILAQILIDEPYNIANRTMIYHAIEDCHEYLESRYYVEFDENGDICFCEYNHKNPEVLR